MLLYKETNFCINTQNTISCRTSSDFGSLELCTNSHTAYGFGKQTCTHSCHMWNSPLIRLHAARDWGKFYDGDKFKRESDGSREGSEDMMCVFKIPCHHLCWSTCVCVLYVCGYVDEWDPLLFLITNTYIWRVKRHVITG